MPNKNPANPGGKEKLPGYPEDRNPAGTPDPRPDEFPGKAPDIYAGKKYRDNKQTDTAEKPGERRDATRPDPEVNQPGKREESNPMQGDRERSAGDERGRDRDRGQQRQ